MRASIAEKRRAFRALHASGCFVLPNPWDIGSARYLESLGFKALATTSAGFAWSRGRADNTMTRQEVLDHLSAMVEATNLPVNADFENGFGSSADDVGVSVELAVETGVAGLSIEDSTGDATHPLFPIDVAVGRLSAARRAIDRKGPETVLVGRAECFIVGRPDLEETIARLRAYASAGADCLYAPGVRAPEDIRAIVDAVAPKPVNVLVSSARGLSIDEAAALGVRRVSTGGAMACAAWGGFARAARELAQHGTFTALADAERGSDLDRLFSKG